MHGQLLCPVPPVYYPRHETSNPMKNFAKISIFATVFLAACAPLELFYKEGETVSQMARDELACETTALRQVPADIRTRYIPPTYQPYKICNGYGHCYWHQRLLSPGRYETYDANAPLRTRATQQCMGEKGYVPTKIKRCDSATTRTTALRATQVLPPLSSNSCAIRLKSGRWQIVTPGA